MEFGEEEPNIVAAVGSCCGIGGCGVGSGGSGGGVEDGGGSGDSDGGGCCCGVHWDDGCDCEGMAASIPSCIPVKKPFPIEIALTNSAA